jgi:hypothetical protein
MAGIPGLLVALTDGYFEFFTEHDGLLSALTAITVP